MDENFSTNNSSTDLFYRYADAITLPKKLSIEQLKKVVGFDNICDEQAKEIIEGLYNLSIITFKKFKDGDRTI